jgi:hypothetical protein
MLLSPFPPRLPRPRAVTAAFALAFIAGAGASDVTAATLRLLSVEALAQRSSGCVVGRVVDERVHWNEAHTVIVTTYTLDVSETLAGEIPTGPTTLTRVGGELDGLRLDYDAMPQLALGDDVAVFVLERAPGAFTIAGLEQGVFHERAGVFVRDLRDVADAPAPLESLPLADLRARVKTAVAGVRH